MGGCGNCAGDCADCNQNALPDGFVLPEADTVEGVAARQAWLVGYRLGYASARRTVVMEMEEFVDRLKEHA